MKLTFKKVLIAIVVIAVVGGIISYINQSSKPKKVAVVTPTYKDIQTTISASGKVQALTQRSLSFSSSGKLLYMPFEEGDEIKKGQLIGYLDQSDVKEQTNKAWSDYRSALEKLREFENNNKDKPKNDAYSISKAQLEASRDSFAALVGSSLANQSKGALVSPIAGTITAVNFKPGEVVTSGSPVVVVADLSQLEFIAETDEQDIGNVLASQSAKLNIDAFPGTDITGTVREISKSSKTNSAGGTYYPTKVTINPTAGTLRSGMNGDVEIITAQLQNVLTVPRDVLQEDGKLEFVYVNLAGKVEKKIVESGLKNDTEAQILKGLSAEDRVISGSVTDLKIGEKVTEN